MAVETPNEDNNNQSGNKQVPVQAGNPRFRPGLDPDPNPKVVVRAINPPITPDQVVSQAESPSATTLPDVKLEKIRIPRVQNKSIQGYLKAIEAKMTATEKLMKDVVKLQNLQIVTEKELHERKRELYQNTFEEYLLDKTVGFDDKDDPDCTCINIPKKPGGGFPFAGGRRRRRGPGGGSPPPMLPPVVENEAENENEAGSDAGEGLGTRDFGDNYAQKEREAINKVEEFRRQQEQKTRVPAKGNPPPDEREVEAEPETPMVPERAPLRVPPGLPVLDPKFVPPFVIPDVVTQAGVPPTPPVVTIPGYDMRVKTHQQDLADAIETYIENNPGSEFEVKLGRGARVDTGHLIKRKDGKTYIHEPLTQEQLVLIGAGNFLNLSGWMPIVPIKGGRRTTTVPGTSLPTTNPARTAPTVPGTNTINPGPSRTQQPVQPLSPVTARGARLGGDRRIMRQSRPVNSKEAQMQVNRDMMEAEMLGQDPRFVKMLMDQGFNFSAGSNVMPRTRKVFQSNRQPGVSFETNMNLSDFLGSGGGFGQRPLSTKEILQQMKQYSPDQYSSPIGPMPQASGGMGEMNLYDSKSKQYFRKISNSMEIPKFAGGGFMTSNEKAEYYMERMLNQALGVARRYDEAKAKAANVQTTTGSVVIPKSGGGLVGWWNKGRNMRVPSENTASWKDLMKDDAKQITRTNKAFKSGATGIKGWNPIKAFTPEMVRTGPTPAVRQAFERPVRTVTHPLMMALEFIVNDLLLNPRSTAVYDQVTGPNAYYNDPAYKGPMPSQNLENAQNSMMSGSNDQKPEVVPLPPDYIKIPGRKKDKSEVGYDAPGIDIEASPFARRDTAYDPGFGVF